jgi:undecaprenyl-diphosphatase
VGHRVGFLDPVFVGLTYAGSLGWIWVAIAAVLAVQRRRPEVLLWVVAADASAELISGGLKALIPRDRPTVHHPEPRALVHVPGGHSFPSGHSAIAFACAGVLAWQAPRLAPALFVLAALIAWSRVYVGVHYPLDVLGGAVLGLLIATALRWLAANPPRSRRAMRAAR